MFGSQPTGNTAQNQTHIEHVWFLLEISQQCFGSLLPLAIPLAHGPQELCHIDAKALRAGVNESLSLVLGHVAGAHRVAVR